MSLKIVKLKEIAEIKSGQILSRILSSKDVLNKSKEERQTIVSKSVAKGYIIDNNLVLNKYKDIPNDKLTKNNDIVLKITNPFNASLIDKNHEGLLVSSFCSLIQANSNDINLKYLVAFLNSELVQHNLQNSVSTSVVSAISIGSIKDLDIYIPSIEIQNEIADRYYKNIENINLMKELIKLEDERLNTLIFKMREDNKNE